MEIHFWSYTEPSSVLLEDSFVTAREGVKRNGLREREREREREFGILLHFKCQFYRIESTRVSYEYWRPVSLPTAGYCSVQSRINRLKEKMGNCWRICPSVTQLVFVSIICLTNSQSVPVFILTVKCGLDLVKKSHSTLSSQFQDLFLQKQGWKSSSGE